MAKELEVFKPYEFVYLDVTSGKYTFIKHETKFTHTKDKASLLLPKETLNGVMRLKSEYAPDKGEGTFIDSDGLAAYNTFVPSKLIASSTNRTTIPKNVNTLLDHLISEKRLKEVFLNALAYHLQTGKAIHLGWIFSGIEGSGKGTLMELLSIVFGRHNVTGASLTSFQGDKIKGTPDKLIAHCDETMDIKVAKEVVNNLKRVIGNASYTSRALFVNEVDVKNWTMFFFTVNSFDFVLTTNDRRMNVIETPKRLVDSVEDVDVFRTDLFAESQEFVDYLLTHKVDTDMTREIVKTEFREKAIRGNLSMNRKIALCITNFSLDYLGDEVDHDDESKKISIKRVEKKIEQLKKVDAVNGVLISGLIKDIFDLTTYKKEYQHPNKVASIIKEVWSYKGIKFNNKKSSRGYLIKEGKNKLFAFKNTQLFKEKTYNY